MSVGEALRHLAEPDPTSVLPVPDVYRYEWDAGAEEGEVCGGVSWRGVARNASVA